ncbi:MAG: ABC transporter substrate-binding protein [Chloroflexi bacterium]|nr:ABC transporter substrate-binding protein [Chloroflexota bacterium]
MPAKREDEAKASVVRRYDKGRFPYRRTVTRRDMARVAASAAALFPAACSTGNAVDSVSATRTAPVTLQFWTNSDDAIDFAKEYEQRAPNTRIEGLKVGDYSVLAEKALANVAAGTPPNVSVLGQRHGITQLADGNALVDIDALLKRQERTDFYPQFIEKFTYKGKLRALPFQSSVPVLFWNKEVFQAAGLDPEKPPATWDEHLDVARKLVKHEPSGETSRWGHLLSSYAWYFYALVWQNGGEVVDRQGQPRFQEPPGVEAAQWWKDWVHKYRVTPSKRPNGTREFSAGRTGMLQSSQTAQANFNRQDGLKYGIAFLPKRKKYAVSIGGNAIGIFKAVGSDRAVAEKASWDFVNWLTGTEMGARIVEETGYLPLRQSTMQTERLKAHFKQHPYAEVPGKQLQYLQAHPIQRADELMWTALEEAFKKVEQDASANPRAELDAVAAQVRQLLAR